MNSPQNYMASRRDGGIRLAVLLAASDGA